jgi:hypothetical protein
MKKLSLAIVAAATLLAAGSGSANATPSFCDAAAGNLIQNCGFESGTFSNWNTVPAATGSVFGVGGPGHTGSFDAFLGATGGLPDAFNQVVATTPGHLYDLQFYFKSDGLTPNGAFVAYFSTAIHQLGGGTDIPAFDWTLEDFSFTATTNSTRIIFGGQDFPGFLNIDDIVLTDATAMPEPATLTLFGAGMLGAAAMRRRKKRS